MKNEKIDLHLHLSLNPMPRSDKLFVSSAEEMLPHLDELGIQKGVLMSYGEEGVPFGTNEQNRLITAKLPKRYAWMCNLNPVDIGTVYERLRNYKQQGAVGIGELMINKPLDDPFLQEIFRAAQDLSLPVTFHMSPEEGFSYGVVDRPGLPLLEKTLRDYPDCKILGHSQAFWIEISADAPKDKESRNQWGKGAVIPGGRVPELFAAYPNLYGDLSANSASRAIMRDPDFGLAFLEQYADRLFFATDMINTEMVFPLGAWLDEQVGAGALRRETYEKICFKNAQRIFGL